MKINNEPPSLVLIMFPLENYKKKLLSELRRKKTPDQIFNPFSSIQEYIHR